MQKLRVKFAGTLPRQAIGAISYPIFHSYVALVRENPMVEAIQRFMRVDEDCCRVKSANGKVSGAMLG